MNFPVKPVLEEIDAIADMGFDYLELTLDAPRAHYAEVRKQKTEILQALGDHGLGLVCHLPTFVSAADLTESIRQASVAEICRSIETAAELGAEKAVLHPPYVRDMGIFVMDTAMRYAFESLETIAKTAGETGMTLCVENMLPAVGAFITPDEFETVFQRFPAFRLTLDTGHATIDGNRLGDFIRRFGDRIGHIHVSDNLGNRDDHLPIGAGRIDFPEFIRTIRKAGYDDTVTFEIFTPDRFYLKRSRDRFAEMLASV